MPEYQRPQGWRFGFGGVNLRNTPDAIPATKYGCAVNIRATSDQAIRTRPGFVPMFSTGHNNAITDMRTYAALGTDDQPRILARDTLNRIVLDNGELATTLSGPAGYGVSMLPFRPGASPQTWMYVAGQGDYQKLSAPSNSNSIIAYKVGIAEPQIPLEAADLYPAFTQLNANNYSGWTAGGTAGNLSTGNLISDTVGTVINDPVTSTRQSLQVSIPYYSYGMLPTFSGSGDLPVEEFWDACATCTITAIYYESGSTGACWIVPSVDISASIGRGTLLTLNSETVLVLGVVKGTNGTCCFRCSTAGTHVAGETITGVRCITVHGAVGSNSNVTFPMVDSTVATGTGTVSRTLPAGSFSAFSPDDYIHITFLLNNIAAVTFLNIVFDVSGTSPDYTTSILTYSITGASLASQLLSGEVVEVHFPISALNGSLNACGGIQIQLVTTDTCIMAFGGLWVGGGGNPDIGDTGAPYQYEAKPRSSITGAQGNPTPPMRYGVTARRQSVLVKTSAVSNGGDPQIDTVDIYRYGGSVTSYRYLGTTPYGQDFIDNYFDDTATAGAQISETDFEPWPTIDIPFKSTGTIVVIGTRIIVTDPTVTWPASILRWLPGTLLQIGGQQTFTLSARPIQLSPTSYEFKIQECAGYIAAANSFFVNEPVVARQFLPYMDGPDAYGIFFAVGDPLRPGGVYWAQSYAPDSAPQTNYLELCSPSEPLMHPFVLQTIILVASVSRWWALYPSFTQAQSYTQIEQPVGRGIISPFGCCKDGLQVYFWAKDGICATNGGPFSSLTDVDLYDLFPHEGVEGQGIQGQNIVRNGVTWWAPDYSRAAQFRLSYVNKMLFADYPDKSGIQRTLVCDLRTGAWSQDIYAAGAVAMASHYAPEQQAGSLLSSGTLYPAMLLADSQGNVYQEQNYVNDNSVPISCTVATFEWDGGDQRSQGEFGDGYLDCLPSSPITVTPMSLGAPAAPATVVPASPGRAFAPISVGGSLMEKYLGFLLEWTDDFTVVQQSTRLDLWQLAVIPQPEITTDRFGEWTNCGKPNNKFFQGVLIHADTFGRPKSIQIRDAESDTLHVLQPAVVNHAGEATLPYSFAAPFYAHEVREEPQDLVPWKKWGIEYVFEDAPEAVQSWITQLSSLGLQGYGTIPRIEAAWSSATDVTLTITVFDGTAPAQITLPATGGSYQKALFTLTANKGQLYGFSATSSGPFQLWLNDWTVWVAQWGRSGPAVPFRNLGGQFGNKARI
jgi:hypothetical protein